MQKRVEELTIIDKQVIRNDYICWEIQSDKVFDKIVPGQFINIHVKDSPGTFARRPFSIHTIDYHHNSIQFMMKVVGDGTKALSKLEIGDKMDVVYPLGNGFSISDEEESLLVGGGYGVAPLYHVAQELIAKGKKPCFLFGARTQNNFILLDRFKNIAELFITTEDGSAGHKGLVTDHPIWKERIASIKKIYSCGPESMMEAVAHIAEKNNILCEASLDQVMCCGVGVCLSCIKNTIRGNEATCLHGPVFNTNDIVW
ncbi:MAG: dihydroorotate dehydrogenase electron transfer subunit [Bacteroidetes bacterium]|nr:dihydroorotate dehydrogenase electron transfer subunit [Bacteroidota bacterium]